MYPIPFNTYSDMFRMRSCSGSNQCESPLVTDFLSICQQQQKLTSLDTSLLPAVTDKIETGTFGNRYFLCGPSLAA
jgi:hypothetical protein